jgi:hypothetical protein
MATEKPVQTLSGLAGEDLSSKQSLAMKYNSSGNIVVCGPGETSIGILQEPDVEGRVVSVMVLGESPAIYGGPVTSGSNLAVGSGGKLVTAAAGDSVVAYAKESGNLNEQHTVILLPRLYSGARGETILQFHLKNTSIADGDLLTDIVLGFAGTIKKFMAMVNDPVTTAAKASTLHIEIEDTPLTGGVLSLGSAGMTPLGKVINATAITANNVLTAAQKISIVAASTTAFIEGETTLTMVIEPAVA